MTHALPATLVLPLLLLLQDPVAGQVPAPREGDAFEAPNVILIVTDDQGYGDLSCHGNPILETPHLDALHGESTRLLDYHVAPTCSPTRSALLTGHWTNRTGVWHTINGRSMLRRNEVTVGDLFGGAGYSTGMFGKWHLGDNAPFRPEDRGFDQVLRHGGGGVGQTPDVWDNAYFDGSYFHNGVPTPVEGYCTDVFFDAAKHFMMEEKAAGRPFFAYIATNAPHGPFHAPVGKAEPFLKAGLRLGVAHFLGMISNIDDNVGALRAFLKREGLDENTILIFTTDNGTAAGESVFNAGMRGKKGSAFDGGHRVPFFLRWPKGGFDRGRDVAPISGHVDVVPTLLDLARISAPEALHFDGRSLTPLLAGEVPGKWPDRILVTDSQRVKDPIRWRKSAVMTDEWRLVSSVSEDGAPVHELFAIQEDPEQKENVFDAHPEVTARLIRFYEDWWEELEPGFGEPTRIDIGNPVENPTRLTSHDWITENLSPWNQGHVRRGTDKPSNLGYWNLLVTRPGTYTIELRRWPATGAAGDAAITDPLPAGEPVPGARAYRTTPGKAISAVRATVDIAGRSLKALVPDGATSVSFQVELEAGPTELTAHFHGEENEITGAYYVYVTREDDR